MAYPFLLTYDIAWRNVYYMTQYSTKEDTMATLIQLTISTLLVTGAYAIVSRLVQTYIFMN